MSWRLLLIAMVLLTLTGCEEDTHEPSAMEVGIKDLILTATASADTIARGDTLRVLMTASNPYRSPVDVWFPNSCQAWLWVYNDRRDDVTPGYGCLAMPTRFHMDPLETREFQLEWHACENIVPGPHTVIAGFHALVSDTRHTADPIAVEVIPKVENVTGEWTGWGYDFWGIPGWEDSRITLTLEQSDLAVSGTLTAGGPEYEIESGQMLDTRLEFELTFESEGIVVEFFGDVCGDRISGRRRVVRVSSREVLDTDIWVVDRMQ